MKSLVICGMSFSGKSTLAGILSSHYADEFEEVVSSTTRPPRQGEMDGREYHFLDKTRFEARIARGEFVDYATIHGQYYGSTVSAFESIHDAGKIPILVCDPNGAKNLAAYAQQHPDFDFLSVFINLNPYDAASRCLDRLTRDAERVTPDRIEDVLRRNASRMTKVFNPDMDTCLRYAREHLSGNPGVNSRLAVDFQTQKTLAVQGKTSHCSEHAWAGAYAYDRTIKTGFNRDSEASVIARLRHDVGLLAQREDYALAQHAL